MKAKSARKGKAKARSDVPHRVLKREELASLMTRLEGGTLSPEDVEVVKSAFTTLEVLTRELESKEVSIGRLRRLLFGPFTEKTADVLKTGSNGAGGVPEGPDDSGAEKPGEASGEQEPKEPALLKKRKGHGRNGAAKYTGARLKPVAHETLKHGGCCPACEIGKVYRQASPQTLLRITGMAPLSADRIELERLRCNGCGEVFTAGPPEGVGTAKYDETVPAMIGVLKYGTGLPFERLEVLQRNLGVPLPASTQWELVSQVQPQLVGAHQELVRQAAQGDVLYNDDTVMRVLSMAAAEALKTDRGEERTGVFTSGIVSEKDGRTIALFYTGREHAGENLAKVLRERPETLSAPIQMSDALSRNTKSLGPQGSFKTVLASCLAHARREFVDVANHFPEECETVLQTFQQVYIHDDEAKSAGLSKEERLRYHQEKSDPLMTKLETWIQKQFDDRLVEPNSSLGKALKYLQNHWSKLTLFLRVAGAPLDNNICERALKKAILHRKNALFYKTENGARVGDTYMSLVYTAELNGENPFEYLVALLRHPDDVAHAPTDWLPWTWRETLARQTDAELTAAA